MSNKKIKNYAELNIFEKIYILFSKLVFRNIVLIVLINFFIEIIDKYLNTQNIFIKIFIIFLGLCLLISIILLIKMFFLIFKMLELHRMMNKSFIGVTKEKEEKCINYFKKNIKYLEFRSEFACYELAVANLTLKPSEFIKFYNNKMEKNKFYVFQDTTKKINCIANYHIVYFIMNFLNKIILGEEAEFKVTKYRQNKFFKNINKLSKNLIRLMKIKYFFILKIIDSYKEKDYKLIYDTLKRYYELYKYDLTKSILVFLYISAKKTGKEIDFLEKETKERLEEALQEEEYTRFIERELGKDI